MDWIFLDFVGFFQHGKILQNPKKILPVLIQIKTDPSVFGSIILQNPKNSTRPNSNRNRPLSILGQ
jgi:hypothetical protein